MNSEFCVQIVPVPVGMRKPVEKLSCKIATNSNGEYTCNWCRKTSKKLSTMAMHIPMKHAVEEGRAVDPYACTYCDAVFSSSSCRLNHIRNKHEIEWMACPHPDCCHEAKNKGNMVTHYGQKHIDLSEHCIMVGDGLAKCLTCEKTMESPKMSRHLATCISASPFCKKVTCVGSKTKSKPKTGGAKR